MLRHSLRILTTRRGRAALLAIVAIGLVSFFDYLTGYEIRLSILYLVPIALMTWSIGLAAGLLAAVLSVLAWGVAFHPTYTHTYSHPIYYYWEGSVLGIIFMLFAMLLHSLRTALAHADRRLLHILDGLPAGIYVTDDEGERPLYANKHFDQAIGTAVEQNEARFERASVVETLAPAETTAGFHYEELRDLQTGRWFLLQTGTIPWDDGRRVQLKVLLDVTDSKQAAALRRQHQELLHNAARSAVLAEIASMLGHEINQPLMAIATYNDACVMLLSRDQPDIAEVIVALGKSRAQAVRASDIIDRTRSFLRRRTPTLAPSDINETARVSVMALELELQEAAVHVQMDLAADLPEVVYDRTLVEQVIVNLLHNALEAMRPPRRGGLIVLRTAAAQEGGVTVSVIDDGPGIPDSVATRLFTPFFTTKTHGLGLGLCICRSVIEAHAGHLWHARGEHGGAAFHFTLPQGPGDAPPTELPDMRGADVRGRSNER
ncbi:MAG TPA: ATP-binding protein [Noviherbaspirillum sp.]